MDDVNLVRIEDNTVQHFEGIQSGWEKAKSLVTRRFEGSRRAQ